jgi:8-oxo-dGTP diphosphatase
MKDRGKTTVLAGGGIVLRGTDEPLIAIVRLRKDKSWVLPKGKAKPGETPLDAARREVTEETGHDVSVHEFLGSMSVVTDRWHKVVQFWRMTDEGRTPHPLTPDVKDVDWLPLNGAIATLTRRHEQVFLESVGAAAIAAARGLPPPAAAPPARSGLLDTIRSWFRAA